MERMTGVLASPAAFGRRMSAWSLTPPEESIVASFQSAPGGTLAARAAAGTRAHSRRARVAQRRVLMTAPTHRNRDPCAVARRCRVLAALIALALPSPAAAHVHSGVVAVGRGAPVASVPPGGGVGVGASALALPLTAGPGRRVRVLGYGREPFLRIDRRGIAVDAASP